MKRKDGLGVKGKQSKDSVGVYYNHSIWMGLSGHRARCEISIIWYFGMFTQVYFRVQEILWFLSSKKATCTGPYLD